MIDIAQESTAQDKTHDHSACRYEISATPGPDYEALRLRLIDAIRARELPPQHRLVLAALETAASGLYWANLTLTVEGICEFLGGMHEAEVRQAVDYLISLGLVRAAP